MHYYKPEISWEDVRKMVRKAREHANKDFIFQAGFSTNELKILREMYMMFFPEIFNTEQDEANSHLLYELVNAACVTDTATAERVAHKPSFLRQKSKLLDLVHQADVSHKATFMREPDDEEDMAHSSNRRRRLETRGEKLFSKIGKKPQKEFRKKKKDSKKKL